MKDLLIRFGDRVVYQGSAAELTTVEGDDTLTIKVRTAAKKGVQEVLGAFLEAAQKQSKSSARQPNSALESAPKADHFEPDPAEFEAPTGDFGPA